MKYPMEDPVRWNLFLPKALLWRMRRKAYHRGIPTSQLARTAIEAYLEALDKRDAQQAPPADGR